MPPSSDFDYHQYYTDHIVPLLVGSSSFLGNCDYAKDFYCVLQRQDHLSNHNYLDATTEQEMNFLIIGEVAPFHRGTKLNALGNHYAGKIGEPVRSCSNFFRTSGTDIFTQPIPVRDKSSAKDILRLVEPTGATDDLKALFANQIVPINEVILADKERDHLNNMVSLIDSCWRLSTNLIRSTLFLLKNVLTRWVCMVISTSSLYSYPRNSECVQHCPSSLFLYLIVFKAPISAYNGDATQRTTKKKVLSLGGPKASKVSVAVEKPMDDIAKSDATALETGTLPL